MVAPLRTSRRPVMNLCELYLLSASAPWQKSTKKRWSKESYRKQEEKHEDFIIPKLNKPYKLVKYDHLNVPGNF